MTIKWKVALVEDDRRLARAVATGLGEEGYTVRAVESANRGLELVRQWNPDVVLLDLMLPDNEGPELFEAFRAETDAALVGISARSSVSDRIAGLKLGADDYVTKPFGVLELLARVEALFRRAGSAAAIPATLSERERFGEVEVIPASRAVLRQGKTVTLTPKEYDLLIALLRRRGAVASRTELLTEVWGYSASVLSRTVDTHVAELRSKLEQDAAQPQHILTVRKAGYRLEA